MRRRRTPPVEYVPGHFTQDTAFFPPGFKARLTDRSDPLCILPSAQMLASRRNQAGAVEATKASAGGFGTIESMNVPEYIRLRPMPVK
jgi:hypothetical protein